MTSSSPGLVSSPGEEFEDEIFYVTFPETLEKILIKIVIIFIANVIVFAIFNPYFFRVKRRPLRGKDYLYILYMALIGTIGAIIVGIVYSLFNQTPKRQRRMS